MSDNRLTIGVVTVSFNQAQFLSEAIGSVIVSDPSRLRYVIVDPGSGDGSRDIINAQTDCFSTIIMEPDAGPADGLNKGMARCEADILGCLNADDRFAPGALDYVLRFFEDNPEVDVIMGAVRIIDSHGRPRLRRRISSEFSVHRYLEGTCLALQQGTFFRRRAWEKTSGFNADNRTCWDTELLVDLALAGARFRTVYKVLGDFRVHPQSITGSNVLTQKYLEDRERICHRAIQSSSCSTSKIVVKIKQLTYLVNPVRRVLEWTVR